MAESPAPGVVTQESLLLAAAERIARIRDGRVAVWLNLSELQPRNRQEGHLRIAFRTLEPMVSAYRGQMFLLAGSDLVFLIKDPNIVDVENVVFKVRALFSKDPLTFVDSGDGIDRFCHWYRLEEEADYAAFLKAVTLAEQDAKGKGREQRESVPEPQPLSAKDLDGVTGVLAGADMASLIRRQTAIRVTEHATAEAIFQEFYVAMDELQRIVGDRFSLVSNRWLFQHLSLSLDEFVLKALAGLRLAVMPGTYSLNLNIQTVLSGSFADFEQSLKARGAGLCVEINVLDVLADSGAYFTARDKLRAAGHQILIDGLSGLSLPFLGGARFGADLYKLAWSPELAEGHVNLFADGGIFAQDVVLIRCDSEAAIQWGMDKGISRFQGRYVDAMLAAYTMAACKDASRCKLGQCIARHARVAGLRRDECTNKTALDSAPVMRAPGRKAAR